MNEHVYINVHVHTCTWCIVSIVNYCAVHKSFVNYIIIKILLDKSIPYY